MRAGVRERPFDDFAMYTIKIIVAIIFLIANNFTVSERNDAFAELVNYIFIMRGYKDSGAEIIDFFQKTHDTL